MFLLATSDIEKAKNFYVNVMEQKIVAELPGWNVAFESGIALQTDFKGHIEGSPIFAKKPTGAKIEIKTRPNNCQIGLEVADLDYWVAKIKATEGIELLHDVAEYEWGQRAIHFYDHDGHLIEIGEELSAVAKRYLAQGMSVEEITEHFGYSQEFVQQLLDEK